MNLDRANQILHKSMQPFERYKLFTFVAPLVAEYQDCSAKFGPSIHSAPSLVTIVLVNFDL